MIAYLASKFKNRRRKQVLQHLTQNSNGGCFAFIGIGQHSMENLYPALLSTGVPVKYLYSRDLQLAQQAARLFPGSTGVADLHHLLDDKEVKGVFICIKNEHQLPLVIRFLDAGKYVFVEKPAVTDYAGLETLLSHPLADRCMIAFNKRFNPLNRELEKEISRSYSYHAKYLTGPYPEGDAVMELFCHPVDNVLQFFGPPKDYCLQHKKVNGGISIQLMMQHEQANGTLELSTCYSWNMFKDQLHCINQRRSIEIDYPGSFLVSPLGYRVGGIPMEKLFRKQRPVFMQQPAAVPVATNNSIWQHGYLQEVTYFVETVNRGGLPEQATPATLQTSFALLDSIRRSIS
ncbi:MAG TPA: Gfo/Idh/MocA family oxidoreductase [Chitinophaga sp.]|uniref:Gfo/Idh/MocA family protein n=1 Tax=Chitinophaga sp. TaxID=1869181 RepID=UPI002C752D1B|nr:Gfo/Idh/MocA family oxidoreductase [Chitinophaga sp.]HVI47154.1 Gfo/Idh/MocA family oxidoreductase [Chitinophaga sp.]